MLDQEELEFQEYVLKLDDDIYRSIKNPEEWRIEIYKISGLELPKRVQEEIEKHDTKIEDCKRFLRSQDLMQENNKLYRYYLSYCNSTDKVTREKFGELVFDVSIECLETDF